MTGCVIPTGAVTAHVETCAVKREEESDALGPTVGRAILSVERADQAEQPCDEEYW